MLSFRVMLEMSGCGSDVVHGFTKPSLAQCFLRSEILADLESYG